MYQMTHRHDKIQCIPANYSSECKLDEGSWFSCNSYVNLTGLSEGNHSFVIRATDVFGYHNTSYLNWTIDITPPIVDIISGPDFVWS